MGVKTFCFFTLFYMKPFPITVALLVRKNLIFFFSPSTLYRKNFCSVLNNLSNFLLSSYLKNVLTKILQKCNCLQIFFKIGVLINFSIFTRKYLFWSFFLIKLQAWWLATLKKRSQCNCFPVNITKCLRIVFFL